MSNSVAILSHMTTEIRDLLAPPSSGTAGMIVDFAREVDGNDSFETDEQRLFGLLVDVLRVYVAEGMTPDAPIETRIMHAASAIEALAENVGLVGAEITVPLESL